MNSACLQLNHISFTYPQSDWNLRKVSLDLAAGQMLGIIGPNGAGKSTLLKIAAALLIPTEGRNHLFGQNIFKLPRRTIARQLAYLPQNITNTFDYRVEEVVAMGRYPHLAGACFYQPADLDIIDRCLESTQMSPFRNRRLSQLSGGQRQRALLASVLAQQPRVLLLDEPTTNLDLYHQTHFFSLLQGLAKQGLAVAIVTHDLNLASLFCHRLLLLHEGRHIINGAVQEVITPRVLTPIYHDRIQIITHPQTAIPIVLPIASQMTPSPSIEAVT